MNAAAPGPVLRDDADARAWLTQERAVSRETMDRLERFVALLEDEGQRQNLIASSTRDRIWVRHIADSAQLLRHAPEIRGTNDIWLDLGSGAGFPGLVVALLTNWQVTLVESRGLRALFLQRVVQDLELGHQVTVMHRQLERVETFSARVISARAFAPLPRLLALAERFSTGNTVWLLPRGKNAVNELETVSKSWHHLFHVEQSITDADGLILVGEGTV